MYGNLWAQTEVKFNEALEAPNSDNKLNSASAFRAALANKDSPLQSAGTWR